MKRYIRSAEAQDKDRLTVPEIKQLLLDKLVDEGWDNVRADQVIVKKKTPEQYTIQIKDYEHLTFLIELEEDDDEYQVWYQAYYTEFPADVEFRDYVISAYSYIEPEKEAIKNIGYYIGTHF